MILREPPAGIFGGQMNGDLAAQLRERRNVEMVVVLVREHDRVQRGKAREVEPPRREYLVVERVLRAELLAQQGIDGDARAIGAKEPALMTEEGGGEHARSSCHKRPRAARSGARRGAVRAGRSRAQPVATRP